MNIDELAEAAGLKPDIEASLEVTSPGFLKRFADLVLDTAAQRLADMTRSDDFYFNATVSVCVGTVRALKTTAQQDAE